jgi:hypothetical protein
MKINLTKFKRWLENNGAEILPNTNDYELIRFKGKETGVIYKTGKMSGRYAEEAFNCYKQGVPWNGRPISTGRSYSYVKEKKQLLKRDGWNCFYCGLPLKDDVSLEHLIPLTQGGLNILSNMVLAHEKCNMELWNKTICQKVEVAITKRIKMQKEY